MSPPAPPHRHGPGAQRRALALAAAAAAACAACWADRTAFVAGSLGALGGPALAGARGVRSGAVARWAGPDDSEAQPPSMSQAGVYMTDVDAITAELDVSNLPEETGVYAVYDVNSKLQYIGLSRQISKSVEAHAKAIGASEAGSLISSVRALPMPGESKEMLKATWEKWIREHMDNGGEIPPGNLPEGAVGSDTRWRNTKPANTKAPLNLAGARGITSMAEAVESVKEAVQKNPVVIFMKGTPTVPQCGFSARSVSILREIGVPYDSVNVMDNVGNPGVREAVKEYSKWPTIPQLFVNGELIGGADIIGEMYQAGTLQTLLKSAGAGKAAAAGGPSAAAGTTTAERGEILLINDARRPTASTLSRILNENFDLYGLRIVDDSAQHEGDAGAMEMGLQGESHFTVEIVAPDFDGLTPVQRQQKVFAALSDVMPRIHALSLVTRTPVEASKSKVSA